MDEEDEEDMYHSLISIADTESNEQELHDVDALNGDSQFQMAPVLTYAPI
jgi:hypothetical protein